MKMLMKGNLERTQEPTAANKTSSRSHAILQVIVKQRNRVRNTMQEVRTGKLYLIDLAGSERAANSMNRGKRMVEGAHINRSLLALGNCINALSELLSSFTKHYLAKVILSLFGILRIFFWILNWVICIMTMENF